MSIVNQAENITFQIIKKDNCVNCVLLNFYNKDNYSEENLSIDEDFIHVLSSAEQKMNRKRLAERLWKTSVFHKKQSFESQAREEKREDVKQVLTEIADALDALDVNKIKVELIKE